MSDREALLAAILAEPADDTARLVFADFLDDVEEYVRATIIRAGVAEPADCLFGYNYLGHGWTFNGARKLHPRGTTQRLRLELPTLNRFADPRTQWFFYRGFLRTVRTTFSAWVKYGEELCSLHPIEDVQLTTAPAPEFSEDYLAGNSPLWKRIQFKRSYTLPHVA